jgi:hypothetical protein
MSLVVIPAPAGSRHRTTDPGPVGQLATTLLSVTVAGLAEPGRFRRGRTYAAQGAVVRLVLDTGVIRAEVQGSDPVPYDVEVRVPTLAASLAIGPAPERSQIPRLIPDADEFDTWCSCPDGDAPCKHAVAVLMRLATEFGTSPDLLVLWRCGDQAARSRAEVGSRSRPERHLQSVPSGGRGAGLAERRPEPPSPFETDAWQTYTGRHLPAPGDWTALVADAPAPVFTSLVVDRTDVGAMVASMVGAITRAFGSSAR